MTIGQALSDELDRRRLSQREAAERLDVAQQTLSKWIRGEYLPGNEHIAGLAGFLRVSEKRVRELRAASPQPERSDRRVAERLGTLEGEVADLRKAITKLVAMIDAQP